MNLQLNGKCVKVFDTQYQSKKDGQMHPKHHFVIEVQDGNFIKKVCFSVMDEERWKGMGIVEGYTYNVSFEVSSREWNGNFYNDINAWRAVVVGNQQAQNTPVQSQQPSPQAVSGGYQQQQGSNNLPF